MKDQKIVQPIISGAVSLQGKSKNGFNFVKFTSKYLKLVCGLKIRKDHVIISEEDYKNIGAVDIFLDLEKMAIKIIEGDTYKLSVVNKKYPNTKSFSSTGLIKNGIKLGFYKYIGNNIFVKEHIE
ncbi:MAG: hypothetical protein AABY22_32930 [Nanoarchaeota archaeon]